VDAREFRPPSLADLTRWIIRKGVGHAQESRGTFLRSKGNENCRFTLEEYSDIEDTRSRNEKELDEKEKGPRGEKRRLKKTKLTLRHYQAGE